MGQNDRYAAGNQQKSSAKDTTPTEFHLVQAEKNHCTIAQAHPHRLHHKPQKISEANSATPTIPKHQGEQQLLLVQRGQQ